MTLLEVASQAEAPPEVGGWTVVAIVVVIIIVIIALSGLQNPVSEDRRYSSDNRLEKAQVEEYDVSQEEEDSSLVLSDDESQEQRN